MFLAIATTRDNTILSLLQPTANEFISSRNKRYISVYTELKLFRCSRSYPLLWIPPGTSRYEGISLPIEGSVIGRRSVGYQIIDQFYE